MMVYINFNLRCLFFCNFISQITSDEIVEKKPRCLLSMLCGDVLFPRNCVGCWSCERLPSGRLGARKYQSAAYSVLRAPLLFAIGRQSKNMEFFLSPQNCVRWCCLLCSSSPWWLCSSRCPPHLGALAACVTPTPGRSQNRSQPRSFQPSPVWKTGRRRFSAS